MNSRERQLATIRHEPVDRISVDAICVENVAEIANYLQIEPSAVLDRLGIDGRIISAGYLGKVCEPENGVYFSEWGTPSTGDYGAYRFNPLADADSVSDVEKYPYPDPSNYNFEATGDFAKAWGDKYALRGPYWRPCSVRCATFSAWKKRWSEC